MASHVGHARVPTVAGQVEIEWTLDALADLNRFAAFLHERFPDLAARVASELVERLIVRFAREHLSQDVLDWP